MRLSDNSYTNMRINLLIRACSLKSFIITDKFHWFHTQSSQSLIYKIYPSWTMSLIESGGGAGELLFCCEIFLTSDSLQEQLIPEIMSLESLPSTSSSFIPGWPNIKLVVTIVLLSSSISFGSVGSSLEENFSGTLLAIGKDGSWVKGKLSWWGLHENESGSVLFMELCVLFALGWNAISWLLVGLAKGMLLRLCCETVTSVVSQVDFLFRWVPFDAELFVVDPRWRARPWEYPFRPRLSCPPPRGFWAVPLRLTHPHMRGVRCGWEWPWASQQQQNKFSLNCYRERERYIRIS